MSRYACVAEQKAAGFAVATACEIADVSTSGFMTGLDARLAKRPWVRSPRPSWSR